MKPRCPSRSIAIVGLILSFVQSKMRALHERQPTILSFGTLPQNLFREIAPIILSVVDAHRLTIYGLLACLSIDHYFV